MSRWLPLLLVAGCSSTPDPCAGFVGQSCIALEITAADATTSVDRITVYGAGFSHPDQTPSDASVPDARSLPLVVALVPGPSFQPPRLDITLFGALNGTPVGGAHLVATLDPGQHIHLSTTLTSGGGDGGTPDMMQCKDPSCMSSDGGNPPSVLSAPITSTSSLSSSFGMLGEDVDRDGKPDVVIYGSGGISVMRGSGTSSLTPAGTYSFGIQPNGVAVGDIDGDTWPDLLAAGAGAPKWLLNRQDGTFATSVDGGTPALSLAGVAAIQLVDLTFDNKRDLIVGHLDNTVGILLGNGNGTFGSEATFATGGSGAGGAKVLTTGDFNSDGHVDVVVGNEDGSISTLYGNGTGALNAGMKTVLSASPVPILVGSADVDGDGVSDVVAVYANSAQAAVSVLLGTHTNGFLPAKTTAFNAQPKVFGVGDLNNDGHEDVVVAVLNRGTLDQGSVVYLQGNGDGTFASRGTYSCGSAASAVVIADVDGDQKRDVIVSSESTSTVSVLRFLGP